MEDVLTAPQENVGPRGWHCGKCGFEYPNEKGSGPRTEGHSEEECLLREVMLS